MLAFTKEQLSLVYGPFYINKYNNLCSLDKLEVVFIAPLISSAGIFFFPSVLIQRASVFQFHGCNHSAVILEPRSPSKLPAAAAKSFQSCPTLCDAIDGSPPGSPVPGILQARTLEWVVISFSNA